MVEFNGKFDNNCQETSIPVSLQSFITAVLRGSALETNTNPHYRQATLTIGQLMAFNTTIRIRNQSSFAYYSRKREPPVAVCVAQRIHCKTRNLSMISSISKLGMCISQERFVQLSVGMGNTVIDMNEKDGVVLLLIYGKVFSQPHPLIILMFQLSPRLLSHRFIEQLLQLISIYHLKTRVSSEFSQELCQLTLN